MANKHAHIPVSWLGKDGAWENGLGDICHVPGAIVGDSCVPPEGGGLTTPALRYQADGGTFPCFLAHHTVWPCRESGQPAGERAGVSAASSVHSTFNVSNLSLVFLSFPSSSSSSVSSDQIEQLHRRFKQLSGDQPTIR